jgi:hypothetical protein
MITLHNQQIELTTKVQAYQTQNPPRPSDELMISMWPQSLNLNQVVPIDQETVQKLSEIKTSPVIKFTSNDSYGGLIQSMVKHNICFASRIQLNMGFIIFTKQGVLYGLVLAKGSNFEAMVQKLGVLNNGKVGQQHSSFHGVPVGMNSPLMMNEQQLLQMQGNHPGLQANNMK